MSGLLKGGDERGQETLVDAMTYRMATPLAVARGCIDHLNEHSGALSEQQRHELFRALDRAVASLERLSSNLRCQALLDNPALAEEFAQISISRLIDEVMEDLVDFGEQRNVEVVFRNEEGVPDTFRGSHVLVRQAIENLVTNAVKHSSRNSEVVVTCRRDEAGIRFEVRDRGPGIPPSAPDGLFDRFNDPTETAVEVPGIGLGLSIVRRVADAHAGTVGVAGHGADGTTFWITLPAEPSKRS